MNRKRIVLTIATIFLAVTAPHGIAASTVSLPLQLIPQSKAHIEYIIVKTKNGTSNEARVVGNLEILRLTSDGFEANWTTNSIEVGDVVYDKSSQLAARLFLGVPFRFFGDKDGLPTKLSNRDSLVESVTKSEAFAKYDATAMKHSLNMLADLSDEAVAQLFIKVPSKMSFCQGTNLEPGVVLEGNGQAPGPWKNSTVNADVTYKLVTVNDDVNTAVIEYRSSYNPDGLKRSVERLATTQLPRTEKTEKELQKLEVSRIDEANCVVDTNTGWVKTMTYSKQINVTGGSQSEQYEISVSWLE